MQRAPQRVAARQLQPEQASARRQARDPALTEQPPQEVFATQPREGPSVRSREQERVLARPQRPEQAPARRRELGWALAK